MTYQDQDYPADLLLEKIEALDKRIQHLEWLADTKALEERVESLEKSLSAPETCSCFTNYSCGIHA